MHTIKVFCPKWLSRVNSALPEEVGAYYSLQLMERANRYGEPTYALGLFGVAENWGFSQAIIGYPSVLGIQKGTARCILRGIKTGKVSVPQGSLPLGAVIKYFHDCQAVGYVPKETQLHEVVGPYSEEEKSWGFQ